KMLYLATEKVELKWTRNYPNWDLVINELNIRFSEVLSKNA
ncbi:MAG: transposase, partial [Sarcina sp.]